MKRVAVAASFGVLCAVAVSDHGARAFEGVCTSSAQQFAEDPNVFAADYVICGHDKLHGYGNVEDYPPCATNLEGGARYPQLGEHAWLTIVGLQLAGIGPINASLSGGSGTPTFVTGLPVEGGSPLFSREPPGPGAMSAYASDTDPKRSLGHHAIAEYSEFPDFSYSVSDAILGDEHCFNPFAANTTLADIESCHAFSTHLGPVNSTHFSPQNRAMYGVYHAIALAVQARCNAMQPLLNGKPLEYPFTNAVGMCEVEALSMEAAGLHFLQDAWSAGHMWERWGSPLLSASLLGRIGQMAVAGESGMIHGMRSLIPLDDQMCMPGPYDPGDAMVKFGFLGDPTNARNAAGGDLYLLPCTSVIPSWSITNAPELSFQRNRVLTCVAKALADVYNAGPRLFTKGAKATLAPSLDLVTDPDGIYPVTMQTDAAIAGSSKSVGDIDGCWQQRATNESMYLGYGVSGWPETRNPATVGRTLLVLEGLGSLLTSPDVNATLDKFRVDNVRIATQLALRAADAPDDLDVATLSTIPTPVLPKDEKLATLLWSQKNSNYVDFITGGTVPYLEAADPATWDPTPGASCSSDADCNATPGTYCDHGSVGADGKVGRHCMHHEASILRLYRTAELPTWCKSERISDLVAVEDNNVALFTPATKDACSQLITPHRRKACDQPSYDQAKAAWKAAGMDATVNDAVCDYLGTTFAPVYSGGYANLCDITKNDVAKAALSPSSATYDVDLVPGGGGAMTPAGVAAGSYNESNRYSCATAIGARYHVYDVTAMMGLSLTFTAAPAPIVLRDGSTVSSVTPNVTVYVDKDCSSQIAAGVGSAGYYVDGSWPTICVAVTTAGVDQGWARYNYSVAAK